VEVEAGFPLFAASNVRHRLISPRSALCRRLSEL
jgi:hypothetical protein